MELESKRQRRHFFIAPRVCLIVVLYLFPAAISQDAFPRLINDIINYYGKPAVVSEFSCTKRSVELFKNLSRNYAANVIFDFTKDFLPLPPVANNLIFLVNIQCSNATDLLRKASDGSYFSSKFKWIIYNINDLSKIDSIFNQLNVLIDSDVNLLTTNYAIKKIYKRKINSSLIIEEMGYWSNQSKLKIVDNFENITAKRRKNLMGTVLKSCMVVTHNDSLNHLTDKRDRHIDSILKVSYVLNRHLSDIVNVTYNYSIEDTWGYQDNKSEWSGMIGKLIRKEADIGDTPLFITEQRVDLVDYIAMLAKTRSKFVFRQPKLSYVTNVFTLPFHMSVWLSIIALVLLCGVVLYIVIKWEWIKKKYVELTVNTNEPELHDSFLESIFISFGALCQQGAASVPFSLPGRITVIFLFVSLMFLYTSYSANIVALLQSASHSIQTLEDLLKSRLQVGVDDTVFNRFFFPNATEPIRRAIYLTKVAPPGKPSSFMPITEGVKRMRQGLFAFHMETGSGYKLVGETFHEDEKCGLQEIQYLQVPDPWMAIQKNSSYKEILKIGLHMIQESGIQYREHSLIYTKKPICISRGASFISVGLVDCYPAAVVLAGGIILSVAIFIFEHYLHYRVQRYKQVFQKFKCIEPFVK